MPRPRPGPARARRRAAPGSSARTPRSAPRRSGGRGRRRPGRRSRAPASSGCRTRSRSRSRCRSRPGSRWRARRRPPHELDLVLERELGRVDADHDQPVVAVGLRPGADVRLGAQPVDARQRPEVDEDDVAAQLGGAEWLGVEPPGRPVERGHVQRPKIARSDLAAATRPGVAARGTGRGTGQRRQHARRAPARRASGRCRG